MIMLVLEGILINVFETPKGVTKDGKRVWRRIKNSGHVRKHVGKRRKTHRDGDFDRCRHFPYLNKKNAPVRVPVALNVYQGKAYLKATI